MQIITAPNAPAAVGPYSQAIRTGNLLFCSGQIPINPTSGKIEAGVLYDLSTKVGDKFAIPRAPQSTRIDDNVPDVVLRLLGYFLADGSHTGYRQFRLAVSRPHKINSLRELALYQREGVKADAGRTAQAGGRVTGPARHGAVG